MKKKFGNIKYTESLILFMIWIAIISIPIFLLQEDGEVLWDQVMVAWMGLLPFFILFIINHFILVPFFLFKNRKILYLIFAFALVVIFSISLFLIEKPSPNGPPPHKRKHFSQPPGRIENFEFKKKPSPHPVNRPGPMPPYINTLIISILVVGFDTGLRMMVRWSKLEQEKTLLEKENIQNQLAFLRNQVSPHFFMNTLNNIHALIDVDTEEAKETIIKLSKLMRHILYDSDADLVPLKKELEFITSYTNLMKLRFSDKVNISLFVPEILPNKVIPPYLFTSFVENAFKHGISYQNSSFVDIRFSLEKEYLTFEIKNSKPENKKENSASGIGIINSRKRLDIIYGADYSLDIQDSNEEYKLTLKIPV